MNLLPPNNPIQYEIKEPTKDPNVETTITAHIDIEPSTVKNPAKGITSSEGIGKIILSKTIKKESAGYPPKEMPWMIRSANCTNII